MANDYQIVYSSIEGVRGWIAPRIRAELYDHTDAEGDMLFPVATAYLSDYRGFPHTGLGIMLSFILVPDQYRRLGYAKALILAIKERFPELTTTDAISPEGEALLDSLETVLGFGIDSDND